MGNGSPPPKKAPCKEGRSEEAEEKEVVHHDPPGEEVHARPAGTGLREHVLVLSPDPLGQVSPFL